MNRDDFYAHLAPLDHERLKKTLWTLYWRGDAKMRQRIEAELLPPARQQTTQQALDPQAVLAQVQEFVSLARSGAYLGRDRRVSPKERTRWRFTFRRLAGQAQDALAADDPAAGAAAVELLVDLAAEMRSYDYVRSEDPVEAARFVVSDAVERLWGRTRDVYGFPVFAERAAPQLIRWESRCGWTRQGWGSVAEKETSLASVLQPMLTGPDMWVSFADAYLEALDGIADGAARKRRSGRDTRFEREDRADDLAEWHRLLVDRLPDYDADDRLDRLAGHPALGGPELAVVEARSGHQPSQR